MGQFRKVLERATQGDAEAIKELYKQYQPMLKKKSILNGKFDEDLYQTLSIAFLTAVSKYKIEH